MERACFAYASPGVAGSWGGACYLRGRASYLRGCPSQGPPTPQGLHIPRVPGASYPGAIPVERPEHPITGADLYLGARCASFRGATFPGARAGHLFGAAYSPGGGTWPVQRGHLSLGLPGTSYHMGRLSQGCPEQSKRAAFLHMHCSHLSGLRCGTLVGWWHVIDLGTTWLVDDLRPRFSFQLSETARRRRRVVWALGLHEHTCGVGMGWCFVYRERMQIRDCLLSCAVPCARKIAVENAGTVAPHQLDQLVF